MWLLKTEPTEYSYADLEKQGKATWDGVTNPVALKNMRSMKAGDRAFIYHTGGEKAAVGVAEVTRAAYADPRAKDPRIVVVDIKPIGRLPRPVALAELKGLALFKDSPLARQGRLSVVPLTAAQWKAIDERGRA